MGTNTHILTAAQLFGRRVREERLRQNHLSQQGLAERLRKIGKPLDRTMIGRIERGESTAMLDQVLALAAALGVAPIDLITPTDASVSVEVAGTLVVPGAVARAWIRGNAPLPGQPWATYLTGRPRTEVRELVRRLLDRRLPSGNALALAAAGPWTDEERAQYDAERERAITDVADLLDDLAAVEADRMKGD